MRRVAVLAGLALLATGCGGNGGGGGGGGGSASADAISKAASQTSKTGSVKVDLEITGRGISGDGSGAFETSKSGSGRLSLTVEAQGQSTTVDTLVTEKVLYLRSEAFDQILPAGKEWVRLDLEKLAQQSNLDLGNLVDSTPTPNGALAYLRGITADVERVGAEEVGGVATTHYRATIDLDEAAKRASGSERKAIRRVIDASGIDRLPVDVWVGKDGYVHKVVYRQYAGRQSARVAMQLHDFGVAVSIASPPASTVLDFQDIVNP
jgi:hypothetical protein